MLHNFCDKTRLLVISGRMTDCRSFDRKMYHFRHSTKKNAIIQQTSFDLQYPERATRWEPRRMSSVPHEGPRRSSRKPQDKTIPRPACEERKTQRTRRTAQPACRKEAGSKTQRARRKKSADMARFVDAVYYFVAIGHHR